jgi:hypothetical protein
MTPSDAGICREHASVNSSSQEHVAADIHAEVRMPPNVSVSLDGARVLPC